MFHISTSLLLFKFIQNQTWIIIFLQIFNAFTNFFVLKIFQFQ